MSMSLNSILQSLKTPVPSASGYITNGLGARQVHDVFFTDQLGAAVRGRMEFTFGRWKATTAVSGAPVAVTYDATYGHFCFTTVYAAALVTSFGGITVTAVSHAAGTFGWVQTGGMNAVTIANTGAIAAGARFEHNGSGVTVKTLASAVNTFGFLQGVASAGDGTIPVGAAILDRGRW